MTESELIYLENENLIYSALKKHYPSYYHDEDIRQIGRIGLWKACSTYNESKSKFSTYAYSCILNELKMHFRKENVTKRKPDEPIRSLNYLYDRDDSDPCSLESILVAPDIGWLDTEHFIESLTSRQKRIVELRIKGFKQREIAAKLGVVQPTICKELSNIRRKYERYI